jgi:hypothetical protein
MWTRIKFVFNVTLIFVTCVRMLEAWILKRPVPDEASEWGSRLLNRDTCAGIG